MARRSRCTDSGLGAALTIYLGVCVGLTACFGAGLYWLMQPSVFPNPGLAAYKPPANFVVTFAGSASPSMPPAPLPAPPATVSPEPAVEAATVTNVTPKKEAKKQHAVTSSRARGPRQERPNPMWDYAYQPSFTYRPWF
jgi:hypothetical protein